MTFVIAVNLTNAMIQTEVTDELRGRVMGIYVLVFFGLTPIGSLLAGVIAQRFDEQSHRIGQWNYHAWIGIIRRHPHALFAPRGLDDNRFNYSHRAKAHFKGYFPKLEA